MTYTKRDLLIAERTVSALHMLIAEQEVRLCTIESQPDLRKELDGMLKQFRESLETQRDRYSQIFRSLHGNEPEGPKRLAAWRLNPPRRR